ncbi:hypothetical protein PMAA_058400 [Talaromyces marneffei ATCC 18224]|uniref:BTB domain-containing protein n=1 Tax=Talaromyces marneffei (strain ATCC 18224 / CBS 334.59 / QM 7333) TaxID=441960 RepID=B6QLT3_TALMQ|nr:hypothetical protein PMAA_058400 [Talaromyces marneffei ATCC 18224]
MVNYKEIISSSHFTFLVGEKKTPLTIHPAVVKTLSAPLGVATLEEVDVDTFIGFCEYVYTGAYMTPKCKYDAKAATPNEARSNQISQRDRKYNISQSSNYCDHCDE